ncbi:MAG: S-methyl-5-thioribose-1-phosphate isomerase [Thermotogae bacterium]|nr:MAG: S-methyl-5-thioribose-1-phosphate isomerase [Thermotogota bacterium]
MKLKTMTMEWTGNSLKLVDQRKLPHVIEIVECGSYHQVAEAIREMIVRGAPAIGAAAAFGYVLGAMESPENDDISSIKAHMRNVYKKLASTRPTAVNLFWALNRMEKTLTEISDLSQMIETLEQEALRIAYEDIEINKTIGRYGASLLKEKSSVLTHCNAGALATVDYGTALGVIRSAVSQGKKIKVYVDETRPYLQGARLTAWELLQEGIPATLITDNMAGWVIKQKLVDAVVVGADRIAANGDVANKIGTYSVAVLANRNKIPFYVAAPVSTIDPEIKSGSEIPIEERSHSEVTHVNGVKIAPEGIGVYNPAFDVTEHELITAIITERGIIRPPYKENIARIIWGGK